MITTARKKSTQPKASSNDVGEHLRTPEEMAAYLDAWLDEASDDVTGIVRALGDIARAKGMSQVAKEAWLSRKSLIESQAKAAIRGLRRHSKSLERWECACMPNRPERLTAWS